MDQVTCSQCGGANPAGFKFCGHCGAALAAPSAPKTSQARPADLPGAGVGGDERRQVTVLFADVSGFTQMSERLEAEDVHALMNEVFAGLGQAIRDEGGHIDKYIGDNVMALFGAPTAHEDDPLRACRAALNMQSFLREFAAKTQQRHGVSLAMRIGINDGLVVAGAVGSDLKHQYSVMGDAVNVASRLESAAEPGTVLVAEQVHRRARSHFNFGPPQSLHVKGKAEPITAYRLLDEHTAAVVSEEAPLIGREAELTDLAARLQHPGVTEVRGERGVGKARLIREAAQRRGGTLITVMPTETTARRPFGLLRRIVQAILIHRSGEVASVQSRESFAAALAGLGEQLRDYGDALWYLGAASPAVPEPPDPDPLMLRRTIERGFEQLLHAMAAAEPRVILFIRERQLADEASAQWLERAAASGNLPLTLVLSCSNPQSESFAGDVLTLQALASDAAAELLADLTQRAALPPAVHNDLIRRGAGVPLFLEHLVQALRDQGLLTQDAAGNSTWCAEAAVRDVELPGTLRSAMLSRVDRLVHDQRQLLYQAAVQGVEFDLDVCAAVRRVPRWSGPPVDPLIDDLDRQQVVTTAAAPLALRRRSFRQELMQQVCYETLLRRDRRELHALTAEALREQSRDARCAAADLLAFHEQRAERWDRAAEAMLHAAEDAAEVYLNAQALDRFDQVITFAQRAGAEQSAMRRLIALAHRGAAGVHLLLGDYGKAAERAAAMADAAVGSAQAAEAKRLFAEIAGRTGRAAEALQALQDVVGDISVQTCGELDVLSRAWADLAQLHHRAGRLDEALACVKHCCEAICSNPRLSGLQADMIEGAILHTRGEFEQAQRLYQHARDEAAAAGSLSHLARAANCVGNCARDRGDYEEARRCYEHAMEVWGRMADVECIAGACTNLGNVAMSIGAFDEAEARHRSALETWSVIGNVRGVALAHANLAILALERGDGAAAVEQADAALAQLSSEADKVLRSQVQVVRAEGLIAYGRVEEAEHLLRKLHADATQPLVVAGVQRALGRAAEHRGQLHEARRQYESAIAAFEQLRRKQETARTRLLLVNVLHASGDARQARVQLDAAVQELEQSAAVHDLARARRMQSELAQAPPIRTRS